MTFMVSSTESTRPKKWHVFITDATGMQYVCIRTEGNGIITLRPYRPSKYKIVALIQMLWLKSMVLFKIY